MTACGLSLVADSRTFQGGMQASHRGAFSCFRAPAVGTWASEVPAVGSVAVAHRLSCSKTCGLFLHQGSGQCPLHCKADS